MARVRDYRGYQGLEPQPLISTLFWMLLLLDFTSINGHCRHSQGMQVSFITQCYRPCRYIGAGEPDEWGTNNSYITRSWQC